MPVSPEQIRERIVRTLGPVTSVLDVGCGDCSLVRFLAQELAREARGIDIKSSTVRETVDSHEDGRARIVQCEPMNAERMDDFPDECFDGVVSVHALHEISDPGAALCEIRRVLKRGGKLLIADFTEGETRWDENYYTPADVRRMLLEAGFHDVAVESPPGEHFMFAEARK